TDDTLREIKKLPVKYVSFRINKGKAEALMSGFAKATGGIIITMDGDLQDNPAEIPNFIKKINEGYDLVSGWKKDRKDPFHKTIPSKVFNSLTSKISGIKLHDFNCGFKAYTKEAAKSVRIYGELHRYIPFLLHSQGFKIAEMPVNHRPRIHGKSKYGTSRILKGFLDLISIKFISTFGKRPLHFFGTVGFILMAIGSLGIFTLLFLNVFFGLNLLRASLILSMLSLMVGIQLLAIGLLGEMMINLNGGNLK
ncbi:MAG: glycosyltransferase family 2 protein, partial [Nanoarchaeota archaeon]|nr:glycosyltransferase family 2 protein [Nanoarchaeota archaeon]